MARMGLGREWTCLFANDFDFKKCRSYRENWGLAELVPGDIRTLTSKDLRGVADLAWASFPCQDLSLAGGGAGLRGERSGTFWPFWKRMQELRAEARQPRIIVLENVYGTLSSHGGKDFTAIVEAMVDLDYRVGAMIIDAELFVPQSRPRLFFVGVHNGSTVDPGLTSEAPDSTWHPPKLVKAFNELKPKQRNNWIWWQVPAPPKRRKGLTDIVEDCPNDVGWHTREQTAQLLAMMAPLHRKRVEAAKASGRRVVGTIYRRTRKDAQKRSVQRAEVRFDDVSGCLRTPAGGSSRQLLLFVHGDSVRSRLISARETATLMGLPRRYQLPPNYNEAYHLTGDGVVVDVVRHLSRNLLLPLVADRSAKAAA